MLLADREAVKGGYLPLIKIKASASKAAFMVSLQGRYCPGRPLLEVRQFDGLLVAQSTNLKCFQNGDGAMRMMLKFTLPVEQSNAAVKDGSLGRTIESVLSKLKPEAAYFTPLEGKRGGMIFFDLADPSQIVESVEPFFLGLNATTELIPVMNGDDLRKGLAKVAGK